MPARSVWTSDPPVVGLSGEAFACLRRVADCLSLNRNVWFSADRHLWRNQVNIGKKAAPLSVAAGALVLGSAAGASAHGLDPFGTIQTNSCETTTSAITHGAADLAGTVGDINIGADCINFSNSGAAVQSNDCDTATGIITHGAASLAPTGDINV